MKFVASQIVTLFDAYLEREGLRFSAIAIGGSALAILGIIDRSTRDLDLLTSPIPMPVQVAAKAFARLHSLDSNWLNDAPSDLARHLPSGWSAECIPLFSGKALELQTLSRLHLIFAKFWAMCDRERDYEDLLKLAPSDQELQKAVQWAIPLDGNEGWPKHVEATAQKIKAGLSAGGV